MFTSIEELEKEVQVFKKNILASSELIDTIEDLISSVKKQSVELSEVSNKIENKMDIQMDNYKSLSLDTVEKIKVEFNDTIKQSGQVLDETVNKLSDNNKRQVDGIVSGLNSVITELKNVQETHINKLGEIENTLQVAQSELTSKYDSFLDKLKSANIDQIFTLYDQIKKSIETKFLMMTCGMIMLAVLLIATMFVK